MPIVAVVGSPHEYGGGFTVLIFPGRVGHRVVGFGTVPVHAPHREPKQFGSFAQNAFGSQCPSLHNDDGPWEQQFERVVHELPPPSGEYGGMPGEQPLPTSAAKRTTWRARSSGRAHTDTADGSRPACERRTCSERQESHP